jgi:hypothetical protein
METLTMINQNNQNRKKDEDKSILEMLEDDYHKLINFLKEKRKYIFWIIVLFITLSTTDILSLGASWESACSENPQFKLKTMSGGDPNGVGGTPTKTDAPDAPDAPAATTTKTDAPDATTTKTGAGADANGPAKTADGPAKTADGPTKTADGPTKTGADAGAQAKTDAGSSLGAGGSGGKPGKKSKASKKSDVSKKKSDSGSSLGAGGSGGSSKIKKSRPASGSRPRSSGMGGSSIGNISGKIFSTFEKAFTIFFTILLIAGILSLPFLLVIVATYYVIKMVAKHFMLY